MLICSVAIDMFLCFRIVSRLYSIVCGYFFSVKYSFRESPLLVYVSIACSFFAAKNIKCVYHNCLLSFWWTLEMFSSPRFWLSQIKLLKLLQRTFVWELALFKKQFLFSWIFTIIILNCIDFCFSLYCAFFSHLSWMSFAFLFLDSCRWRLDYFETFPNFPK